MNATLLNFNTCIITSNCVIHEMALLECFKKKAKPSVPAILPNENGPLCKVIPSSSIRESNSRVTQALQMAGKLKLYLRVSDDQKADIGKHAAEH